MQLRYRLAAALAAATVLTFTSAAISATLMPSHPGAAEVLFWPNTLLQRLAPCPPLNGGCEGTPVNLGMYVASFALSLLVYAIVAYALIGRGVATSNNRWRGP